jgi:hypothetical protein
MRLGALPLVLAALAILAAVAALPALGEEAVRIRVRADPCVRDLKAFSLTLMRPLEVRRLDGLFEVEAQARDTIELAASAEGCRVLGWVEEARGLYTPGERLTWLATYDAEFTVRVERPGILVEVRAEPAKCLGTVATDPASEARRTDAGAVLGPFYSETTLTVRVEAAEGCRLLRIESSDPPGSYYAGPEASMLLRRNTTLRAIFEEVAAQPIAEAPKPSAEPSQPSAPALPAIPEPALPVLAAAASAAAGAVATASIARRRAEARAYEREVAAAVMRQWVRRGRISSTVLAILCSRPAYTPYSPSELALAARRGTAMFDVLGLYRRGQGPLITASAPFEALNSDDQLCLHAAAHLVAAGLAPATREERLRLRASLLPRWYRMVRDGRAAEAEEEARRYVLELRSSPEEARIAGALRDEEAERHPFMQDLITAALSELGLREEAPAPAPMPETRPAEPSPPEAPPKPPEPAIQERPAPREPEPRITPPAAAPQPEAPAAPKPEPEIAPPPKPIEEEVAIAGPEDLYRLFRERGPVRLEGAVPLEMLGAAALMAAERGEQGVLAAMAESMRGSGVAVRPSSLGEEAVYYPEPDGLLRSVAELAGEQHLACLVADVVGGVPVHARPGASVPDAAVIVDEGVDEDVAALAQVLRSRGSPVRIATYSRERAEAIAGSLGLRAVGVGGILESEAALLLEAVGPVQPRLFAALAGSSLLVPELRERIAERPGPGVFERSLTPPACHTVRGFRALVDALERIASGKSVKAVREGLRIEGRDAAEALAAILEPRRVREGEMELTPEALLDLLRSGQRVEAAEAPLEAVGAAALLAAAEGDTAALSTLMELVSSGRLLLIEPQPGGEACYPVLTPEAEELLERLSSREHAACLARRYAPRSKACPEGAGAGEAAPKAPAVPADVVGWAAGRTLRLFARNDLPPNALLFLAVVGSSLLVPELLDSLESSRFGDPSDLVEFASEAVLKLRTCHEPGREARAAAAGMIRAASLGYDYGRLRERYGELAALITLRRRRGGGVAAREERVVREDRPRPWLRILYTDSGYRVEIDSSQAPTRALVVLSSSGTGLPARIPISTDLPVVPLEEAGGEAPERGIVVTFSLPEGRGEDVERLRRILAGPGGRVVAIGFLSGRPEPIEGVELVEGVLDLAHIARLASELGLPYRLCEAYPQVLAARGLPREEAAGRVRRILEELLGGTGYEFLAGLAEDAVRGRRPRAEGLSRRQARIAESLGLL